MKKLTILITLLMIFFGILSASESKLYVGNDEGQFILGIEGKTNSADGGAGMELRTYFRKDGIMVDGKEYGSMLPKIKYSIFCAGTNQDGAFLRLGRDWTYLKDYEGEDLIAVDGKFRIETGYGKGNYLLFH
jgi:hypothetical protein